MSHSITIAEVDRTNDVLNSTISIEDLLNEQANTLNFEMIDRDDSGAPAVADEVIILMPDTTTRIFGGNIVSISLSKSTTGKVAYLIECVDYTGLLDRNLVPKSYENLTDKEIIQDIVSSFAPDSGITTANVTQGVTIDQITFNYFQPSQCIRKIAELTGRNWYIDYNKDIHYFALNEAQTPFDINTSANAYEDLQIRKDGSQIKNRVYVRGGTSLSDFTSYSITGDGELTKFVVPDKPKNITVEVNRGAGLVVETVGIKNIDTQGFDWYVNFQEKYFEQDIGGTVLSATDIFKVTYKFDIPILVAVENKASIETFGQREFAIFDKTISTTQQARDRAAAELTDYALSLVEGTFATYTDGFFSGQTININLPEYGVENVDYIVQKVSVKSFGGGLFRYGITLVSAKTIGIIRFLIKLLEDDKNLVELSDDEVVDELQSVTDSLLTDSLLDSLVIDSSGAYFTWATDSLESTQTRARWDLSQWG